jgi:hypothetical protein
MFLLTDIALGTAVSGIKLSIDLCRGLISSVSSKNNEIHYYNLSKLLEDYDIEYTLNIIETFCKELENKEKDKNKQEKDTEEKNNNEKDSLHLCLMGIHHSIDILTNNLQTIHKKQEEHKLRYFYYWRTCDISSEYTTIEKEIKRLNNRFDLLVKLNKK